VKREHYERMTAPIPPAVQILFILFPKWVHVNWLLLLSLVGFVFNYAHVGVIPTFIINFVAILPYANIVLVAGDELNLRSGEVLGSLVFVSIRSAYFLLAPTLILPVLTQVATCRNW